MDVFLSAYQGTQSSIYPKYIEEGMAILHLFTFWRGWGHDIIVIHQLSKEERITVKILHFWTGTVKWFCFLITQKIKNNGKYTVCLPGKLLHNCNKIFLHEPLILIYSSFIASLKAHSDLCKMQWDCCFNTCNTISPTLLLLMQSIWTKHRRLVSVLPANLVSS